MTQLGLTVATPAPGQTIEITGPDGQVWTIRTIGPDATDSTAPALEESAVDGIVKRWTKFDPDTNAPAVMAKGIDLGFEAVSPEPRQDGSPLPAYIRMVAKNKTGDRVTGFLNTKTLVVNGVAARAVVKDLHGAVVRKNGDIAFSVEDLDACAAVYAALLAS